MKKRLVITLVFILSTMIAYTQSLWPCVFKTGKIGIQETNGIYKIFIQQEHTNECFVPDSTVTYISIYCKESGITIGERVEVGDTLTYKLGTVIIAGSTRWYFGNNWYMCSFSSTCIFGNDYCMEEVVDVPIPPVVIPQVTLNGGIINCNVGATIILIPFDPWTNLFDYQQIKATIYTQAFDYELPYGWTYVTILANNGLSLFNDIVHH